MQLEGWKCLECGVVYAPFVTECRCSVKIQDNVEQAGTVCFHNWPSSSTPCTKCGMVMTEITFMPTVDISGCTHVYPDSSLTTAGRFCSLCGAQEVLWEKPGNTCSICGDTSGVSHTAFGTICGPQGETNG